MSEKKDTKEISVEDKLRALFDLQLIESEIDKIKILRGELPLEVQDLEDEIEGLHTRANNLEKDIKDANDTVISKKKEIEEDKNLIAKYSEQQNSVRNNREYENLSKEIEFQGLNVQLCEKKIAEFTEVAREKAEELERTKAQIEGRSIDLEQKKKELDSIVAETKQKEEALREEAKTHENLIDPRMLTAFKKVRKNAHNGLAVVRVQRNACGGCFNQIPPQKRIDIAQRKKVIVCEYCGRIMVDLDLGNEEVEKTGYGISYDEEQAKEAKKSKK